MAAILDIINLYHKGMIDEAKIAYNQLEPHERSQLKDISRGEEIKSLPTLSRVTDKGKGRVRVTLPPGVMAGQQIHVQTPFGLIAVVVPGGVPPGGQFDVEVPDQGWHDIDMKIIQPVDNAIYKHHHRTRKRSIAAALEAKNAKTSYANELEKFQKELIEKENEPHFLNKEDTPEELEKQINYQLDQITKRQGKGIEKLRKRKSKKHKSRKHKSKKHKSRKHKSRKHKSRK